MVSVTSHYWLSIFQLLVHSLPAVLVPSLQTRHIAVSVSATVQFLPAVGCHLGQLYILMGFRITPHSPLFDSQTVFL